jgi:murein DD-endopeptidase MepM/ murein hydrolase activator NlpD
MDGVVVRANRTAMSGLNIKISHPDGSTSYYLHMSSLWVVAGQRVAQGNVIGKSGNTGNSTGPHLHYSLTNSKGILIDPESVFVAGAGTPNTVRPSIKLGSRGDNVKYLQRRLGIPADGIFGPVTRSAVIRFQKSTGLVADGIVGPKTWKALG